MELDIRATSIDPESNFAKAFRASAQEAWRQEVGYGGGEWLGESEHFGHMRKKIAEDMVQYLLKHNGVIDGWPDPDTDLCIVSQKEYTTEKKTTNHYFHYFGRWPIKYHNQYEYRYSDLYQQTVQKGKYYGRTPGENRKHIFLYWLVRLPLIYAVVVAIMSLLAFFGWDYTGFVDLVVGVQEGTTRIIAPGVDAVLLTPLVILICIPFVCTLFVDTLLAENFGLIGILIGCVVLAGIAYGSYWYLNHRWKPKPQDHRKIKRAYNEKKAFRKSKEYQDVVAAEEAKKRRNEEISEQWHRAWFAFYKNA